ncbi:RNA polymerase sigma factor [Candidatus Viadribacter manganicus]|uniref:RNA polymerase sigma factor n=1 Tax=Candidatus Viadribacter manganicus TaxID=1759059 RepID=UPI0008353913|nr:RNA polymerase sigma factor [Candidatus Viadribacter manganicus]
MSSAQREFQSALVSLLPRLRRFARSLCGASDLSEDVLQTALERALRSSAGFDPARRLDSWMFKIIQNVWIDNRNEFARRRQVQIEEAEHIGLDPTPFLEARSDLVGVVRAFSDLAPEQRAVLTLVVLEDYSYQEAAETLAIPIGTVMSRLARARAAIAEALKSSHQTDEDGRENGQKDLRENGQESG